MSVVGDGVAEAVRSIADVFAAHGTDPLVDWSFPSVHLLHPLSRATFVPHVRERGDGLDVAITRPLWVAQDAAEGAAVAEAVAKLAGNDAIAFAVERAEDGTVAAVGYRLFEHPTESGWCERLRLAHRDLERSAVPAVGDIASVVRSRMAEVSHPRSRLLRCAFAMLEAPDTAWDGTGDRATLAVVTREHVTLRWGAEGLPVFLRLASAQDLDVVTLVAGHDGRWGHDELDVLLFAFAARAVGRPGLRVADVPGDLGHAVGIVSSLAIATGAHGVRRAMEDHLDLAREVAGPPRVGRGRA